MVMTKLNLGADRANTSVLCSVVLKLTQNDGLKSFGFNCHIAGRERSNSSSWIVVDGVSGYLPHPISCVLILYWIQYSFSDVQ